MYSKQGSQIRGSIPTFSLYNFPDIRERVIPLTLAGAKDTGPENLSFEGVEINKVLQIRFLIFRDPGWMVLRFLVRRTRTGGLLGAVSEKEESCRSKKEQIRMPFGY